MTSVGLLGPLCRIHASLHHNHQSPVFNNMAPKTPSNFWSQIAPNYTLTDSCLKEKKKTVALFYIVCVKPINCDCSETFKSTEPLNQEDDVYFNTDNEFQSFIWQLISLLLSSELHFNGKHNCSLVNVHWHIILNHNRFITGARAHLLCTLWNRHWPLNWKMWLPHYFILLSVSHVVAFTSSLM